MCDNKVRNEIRGNSEVSKNENPTVNQNNKKVIQPTILNDHRTLIITDPKGNGCENFLKEKGYDVKVLTPDEEDKNADSKNEADVKRIHEILSNVKEYKQMDESESARKGREICRRYSRYIQVALKCQLAKESGFLGNGSIIRSPEKNSYSSGNRTLNQLIKEESNPKNVFFEMVDIIGEIYAPCREYLILTYYNCYTPKEIAKIWGMTSREVTEIQRIAHAMIAYLTGSAVMK